MTGEWLRRAKNSVQQQYVKRVSAAPLTNDLRAHIDDATADCDKPVYEVRPYPGDGGVRRMMDLLDGMHDIRRQWWVRNVTRPSVFGIAFDRGNLTFRIAPGEPKAGAFRDQFYEDYPHSELRQITGEASPFTTAPEDGPEHTHIAAANGHLHRKAHIPFRHIDVDGFAYSDGASEDRDPYRKVLTDLTTDDRATVWVQVAYRPATFGWTTRGRILRDARSLESGAHQWFLWPREPTDHEERAADTLRNQLNESMYQVAVRIVAAADSKTRAERRVAAAAEALSEYYESNLDQGIYFKPVGSSVPFTGADGRGLRAFLADVASRRANFHGATATTSELAGLAHLPGGDVQNPSIAWTKSKAGAPVPPGFPAVNWDALGIDPETASRAEKWRAMLDPERIDEDSPWWQGFGARKGKPVGIYNDDYDHTARGGRTRYGKTENGLHDFYQAVARGHTAIYIDPKSGDDAKTAVQYTKRVGRGDELYPIRLGGETDHQLGFNLLEIPGSHAPDSPGYGAGLEKMATIVEGALMQADEHTSGQWGSRMSRITRHLCRALGKLDLDEPPTPLTLYYAGTRREKYTDRISDSKLTWLRETAEDVFAEYSDDAIEPWRGRMQQIIESDPLREMACLNHALSFFDLFHDGGVVVIYAENSSRTAMKMLMSGFLPRAYQEYTYQYRNASLPNPTEAHLFADELNDIITETMEFPKMLSNGAGYGFHVHGLMQDYDSQVGEEVEKAFKGQAKNITLNAGTPEFASTVADLHDGFGTGELSRLSKFTAVIRAHDRREGDTLGEQHSVKTMLGPPLHEIDPKMPTVDDAEQLIDQRERETGETTRTDAEIREATTFAPTVDPDGEPGEPDTIRVSETVEQAAAQGVYDAAIRAGQPNGYVHLSECASAIRRRVTRLSETPANAVDLLDTDDDVFRKVLQPMADSDLLETRDRDQFRTAKPRATVASVGTDKSAGGPNHVGILWDAYAPLTRAGIELTVMDASDDDPDALAVPAPERDQEAPALVERLTGGGEVRVEAEHTTGDSQPSMTAKHCLQGAEEGRRTIILTDPETAPKVADTLLADPPLCNSTDSTDDEVRFYTTPRNVLAGSDGHATRPGTKDNVWVRERDDDGSLGDVVLRDTDGTEHARFDDPDDVFSDADAYPGGDRNVKQPVIPDTWNGDVDVEILAVPSRDDEAEPHVLGDLSVVAGPDGLTFPADAVGDDAGPAIVPAADLEVPERNRDLLRTLRDQRGIGAIVTTDDAAECAERAGITNNDGDPLSDRTIRTYMGRLRDDGPCRDAGTTDTGGQRTEVR